MHINGRDEIREAYYKHDGDPVNSRSVYFPQSQIHITIHTIHTHTHTHPTVHIHIMI